MTDSTNREWQTATIQLDFQLPLRFELKYKGADDKEYTPVVIHRAIYGSFERFIGILLEHYNGVLPVWLAPVAVRVLPINDKVKDYAEEVDLKLKAVGVRSELDTEGTLNQRILVATNERVPYMVVIGGREKDAKTVTLRLHDGSQEADLPLESFFPRMMELNE